MSVSQIHRTPGSGMAAEASSVATFLFRSGRRARLANSGPTEFLYGFAELQRGGAPVAMLEEQELGIERLFPRLVERGAGRLAGFCGIHARVLHGLFRHRTQLSTAGTLIATTHAVGIALAALRRWGVLTQDVVIMTMGIITPEASRLRLGWLRWLLAGTTLAALSRPEAAWLRSVLGPRVRVIDFTFGVDLEFWRPDNQRDRRDVVLSVGNDWNRDFATLIEAWRPEFPVLEIVTSLPVNTDKPNVSIVRGDWRRQELSDEDLRARLQRARLVVVPLRDTLQPSGQSAALQAMACGSPVVLTGNRGCWDRAMLEHHDACRFVPPGDASALAAMVAGLLADTTAAEAMGARARRMLENEGISTHAMARQFTEILPALRSSSEGRLQYGTA